MSDAKLISVIVPAHNEVKNIPLLYDALNQISRTFSYMFEFIFVDDGSDDGTAGAVRKIARKDQRVRLLEFARNFGKEAAASAGLHASQGEAVVIMDADLQHPPGLLDKFIRKWEAGAEVVIGVRKTEGKDSWVKKTGSKWFYRIMQRISHVQVTPHATDFRLLDRTVVNEFNRLTEHNRMTRGLIDWLGFRRDYIYFKTPKRRYGEASYTLNKLVALAFSSFTSYSLLPLRLAGYLGGVILAISAPAGLFVLVEQYIIGDPMHLSIRGSGSLALVVLFLIGLVLICLGLVALYIAHIHAEVVDRPLYVVRPQPDEEVSA